MNNQEKAKRTPLAPTTIAGLKPIVEGVEPIAEEVDQNNTVVDESQTIENHIKDENLKESYRKLFLFISLQVHNRYMVASIQDGYLIFKRWKMIPKGILTTIDGSESVDFTRDPITAKDIETINLFLYEEIGI